MWDYNSYDRPSVITDQIRKARKKHRCCECYNDITPGDTYEYVRGLWDGYWSTYKTCMECRELRHTLAGYGDGSWEYSGINDGICASGLHEWIDVDGVYEFIQRCKYWDETEKYEDRCPDCNARVYESTRCSICRAIAWRNPNPTMQILIDEYRKLLEQRDKARARNGWAVIAA